MNEEKIRDDGRIAVFLPEELYCKIEKRLGVTEFQSVEEYVTYAMEEIFKEVEKEQVYELCEEEEELVKKRLRNLGYLD